MNLLCVSKLSCSTWEKNNSCSNQICSITQGRATRFLMYILCVRTCLFFSNREEPRRINPSRQKEKNPAIHLSWCHVEGGADEVILIFNLYCAPLTRTFGLLTMPSSIHHDRTKTSLVVVSCYNLRAYLGDLDGGDAHHFLSQ